MAAALIALAIVLVARATAADSGTATAGGTGAYWFVPDLAVPTGATDSPPDPSGPSYPQGGDGTGDDGRPAVTGATAAVPRRTGDKPPAQSARPDAPPQNATAYTVIQAETFDEQNGIKVENAPTGSGRHVGFITKGDWIRYDDVGFTDVPATRLQISAANWAKDDGTGVVEVRLDDRAADPVGTMTIPNNHSWFDFVTYSMTIRPTTGVHTVYLTFTSTQKEEFGNIDWIRFQH
ncbi:carbohydrate-binding protein [Actinoplanes subglobosus]|uniref:Carbohydrate-binding protein n=2 Tax=Actinoplanes subglobosus TaxID=1547892 RepID=A0ABV8ILQ7_9ACTN